MRTSHFKDFGFRVLNPETAGVALASNLGGMTSPISSPQNVFAIQIMGEDGEAPSWLAWFSVPPLPPLPSQTKLTFFC